MLNTLPPEDQDGDVRQDTKPKYLSLVDAIEHEMTSGIWKAGDRLPSNRDLGSRFNVTIGTVSKAMAEAVRRGLVATRVGSGTYVREDAFSNRDATGAGLPASVDLALNTLPTSIVKEVLKASLERHSTSRLAEDMFAYSVAYRHTGHQAAASQWFASMGARVAPSSILLTIGVHQGLIAALHTLLAPGATAVCEELTYTGIKRIAAQRGVVLRGARMDADGLVPQEVEKALRDSGAKVLVVTTNLQNPTTASLSLERREQLVAICRKADAFIVEDGVNGPLSGDSLPSLHTLAPERTVHLTGFSKCIASGFRLGYAAMPDALLERFHDSLMGTQWIGPGFFASFLATMQQDGALQRCIALHRAEASWRQNLLRSSIPGSVVGSTPCYHAWLQPPAGMASAEFCLEAFNAGIQLSAGEHFAIAADNEHEQPPLGYRLSLGACEGRAELTAALQRLAMLGPRLHVLGTAGSPAV